MKTDSTIKFIPVNIAVLTISDTRNDSTDTSGKILVDKIKELDYMFDKVEDYKSEEVIAKQIIDSL